MALMRGCNHTPRCGSASVHHARRWRDAALARETSSAAMRQFPRDLWDAANSQTRGVPTCKADPKLLRASAGRAPWELSAREFENVCEPWFEPSPFEPGNHRMYGLSIGHMRFGVRLR